MPAGDRTGPAGMGPMSGRGMGYCSGGAGAGFMQGAPRGRMGGAGRRWGGPGRGFGWGYNQPVWSGPVVSEKALVEEQLQQARQQAAMLEERLRGLDTAAEE